MHRFHSCQIVDIDDPLPHTKARFVGGCLTIGEHIRTLRTLHYAPLWEFKLPDPDAPLCLPPTLILAAACLPGAESRWDAIIPLISTPIPNGPKRVVINCTYAWAHQLLISVVGPENDLFPDSVEEIVIRFKKVDYGERPRYVWCKDVLGHSRRHVGHKTIKHLSASSPTPMLAGNQHLHLFKVRNPRDGPTGVDVFTHIAQIYVQMLKARAPKPKKNRGTKKKPKNPQPVKEPSIKLTLVGVDEFDVARDLDVAGDAAFHAIIGQLPWHGPAPPRSEYEYGSYAAVAPTFVERVASLAGHALLPKVLANVKVLSDAEYLATLTQEARDEEDWWTENDFGEVVASGFGGRVPVE
jgi:hypothetical protein